MADGVIIVDHGSRLAESNRLVEEVAARFANRFRDRYPIVEPAHMELAEPTIAVAYARCRERGATQVIVCPLFLGPGKHWTSDIPRLVSEAAGRFPDTTFGVAGTLGADDLILDLLAKRLSEWHAMTSPAVARPVAADSSAMYCQILQFQNSTPAGRDPLAVSRAEDQ